MSMEGASRSLLATPDHGDDTFSLERTLMAQGFSRVAGLDEAGRGPLAGPVVAACVILPLDCDYHRLQDSKKLSAARRETLYHDLHDWGAAIGVATVSARTIDRINILQASLQAMKEAVADCPLSPAFLLVDGKFDVPMPLPQRALVKGESRSASIAAASIVAKVTRDRLMAAYHDRFPEYDFRRNKGYPTKAHRQALARYGPCELHRRTFRGVREYFGRDRQDSRRQGRLF